MHLELIELLRCPVQHRESVLVAATDNVQARFVVDGVLGCPECGAEYRIANGVVHFEHFVRATSVAEKIDASSVNADSVVRLAAQLAIAEGRSVYALVGFSIPFALLLREMIPARLLLINAPPGNCNVQSPTFSQSPSGMLQCDNVLPIVSRKLDGIALEAGALATWETNGDADSVVAQAAATIRSGGRLVAPVSATIPKDFRELARDSSVWVAERAATASAPVELRRR